VFCFNDLVALGLIAGLQRDGVAVGRDIRVVGFDDIEEAALAWPDLSSVSCDIAGFGQDTARALLDWLDSGTRPPAERRAR
jgi:LacI family transcriptional regulator